MKIHRFFLNNPLRNFTYLIESNDGVYCIDPFEKDFIKEKIEQLQKPLVAIINTHEHWDHIGGNKELILDYDCELWAESNAAQSIEGITRFLLNDDKVQIDNKTLLFRSTPGHTKAHLGIFVYSDKKVLESVISGDTVFNAGVGHCRLGGDPNVLYETISQIYSPLEESVELFTGHDYLLNNLKFTISLEPKNEVAIELVNKIESNQMDTTLFTSNFGLERKINSFFRLNSLELRSTLNMQNNSDRDVFLKLRELRNNW